MLKIDYSRQFKKDYVKALSRGLDATLLSTVIGLLAEQKSLPPKFHDHALISSRKYKNVRECHIQPDWLLIYRVENKTLTLYLMRTGAHSDLF